MVADLPSGTVTLLFTDIEGSTRLLHELGERYADVLGEHRRVLRDAFSRYDGVEVDTQGDAFFVAFARASDAVAAARDAQTALDGSPVRVRIGIHSGEPLVTDEGYIGIDVHRAARIMGAAHGGQVLLSETTQRLLDPTLPLQDLGAHRLKDLTPSQRLYQLGNDTFPPLKTLHQTNLPIQTSPLVGRARELEEASALLRSHRLVTLTGPGGSGKTRLALQLAGDAVDDFPDGVFWVPLQALRDSALVERVIAKAIGADGGVIEHIADKRLLILLDNFEQVVEAASTIAALLSATPSATVLATSREPLQLESERRYPVEPLPNEDAVALFVERAQSASPRFQVTPEVQEICQRLDGLPLAVELAAARVALLGPRDLLIRLEQRLPLLTSGFRDVPERQRTLRSTIAWSYELLDHAEQQLFRRLAVFGGSFSVEAAETICDAELSVLESLVVKSLVRRADDGRLAMLETIHEFALEQLNGSREMGDLRRRHADFFVDVAEGANLNPNTFDPSRPIRHDIAAREQNEIYQALAWAVEAAAPLVGLRLATAAGGWLWSINFPREGVRYFDQLFERADVSDVPAVVIADGLREYAAQAFLAGDHEKAARLTQQSLTLYEQLEDEQGRAVMLHRLGIVMLWKGDLDRARRLVAESHATHERRGDRWGLSQTVGTLGAIARDAGDAANAQQLFSESAELARRIGGGYADWWASGMMAELACNALEARRFDEADEHGRAALEIADALRYRAGRVLGVGVLAAIAAACGLLERAEALWGAIENEDAVAPLGGWRRHRATCERFIREARIADGDAHRRLTLDDAVRLALERVA